MAETTTGNLGGAVKSGATGGIAGAAIGGGIALGAGALLANLIPGSEELVDFIKSGAEGTLDSIIADPSIITKADVEFAEKMNEGIQKFAESFAENDTQIGAFQGDVKELADQSSAITETLKTHYAEGVSLSEQSVEALKTFKEAVAGIDVKENADAISPLIDPIADAVKSTVQTGAGIAGAGAGATIGAGVGAGSGSTSFVEREEARRAARAHSTGREA